MGTDYDNKKLLISSEKEYSEEQTIDSFFLDREELVVRIAASLYAKRFDQSVSFDDYKHYGFIGLLEAKANFDDSKGASFDTYATYRIRGSILNGIVKHSEKLQLYAYKSRLENDRLRSLKTADSKVGVDVDSLFDSFVDLASNLAIGVLLDEVADTDINSDTCSDSYYQSEVVSRLVSNIEYLSANEKPVIIYHYFGSLSFNEIADVLGLSKGRISQLHKIGLTKLKTLLSDNEYSKYL